MSKQKDNAKDEKKGKDNAKAEKKDNAKSANQSYNPSASSYHPIDDACWKRGDK